MDNSSLVDFVLSHAVELSDKPALIDGTSNRTITYGALRQLVETTAGGLKDRGFGKRDVLALFLPNLPEYAVAYLAAIRLGGACTTVNPLYTAEELTFQLDDSGAKFLVTAPEFVGTAQEAAAQSSVKEVFVTGESPGAAPFSSVIGGGVLDTDVDIEITEDVAALPYSSGTTGFPKGVMLTHRNLVANICQFRSVHRTSHTDVLIAVLPFFHIYGQQVVMNTGLAQGATIVTLPRFDLEEFLRVVEDYRVTRAYLVPPIILALAKDPIVDDYDHESLQLIVSGAAPLGREVQEEVEQRLKCRIIQGYGLTETSPVTHITPDDAPNKPGSVGPPVPDTECKIVDMESGAEVEPGTTGEIWIRGPQVMKGYLKNALATRSMIDKDGFLHTGDIGCVDDEDYLYVVDRVKELIKYKGFQVAPAELEAVLVSHPDIIDAAVIPVSNEEAGEVPKALVVARSSLKESEVLAFVAERVAPHKKVRFVEFVDEIPKSASGKILRRVLIKNEQSPN